ncbi:MAG: HNH endonuclease, partial [Actinomycetes bacterium]|nr:HNH endonuclease [Actinomycetes bacterium]
TRRTLTGEVLPPAHPHVADALHAGRISVDAARVIMGMLDRVANVADSAALYAAERSLAGRAATLPFHQVVKVVAHEEARLNPGGMVPREEEQRAARSLTMRQDATGMFHLKGVLDPVTGAPIKTAVDAYVTARLRETRGHNHPDRAGSAGTSPTGGAAGTGARGAGDVPGVPDSVETRTIPQLQADALADFARHVVACDTTVPVVPAVTMVVRMDLADLQRGEGGAGYATIDGVDQPISVGAARRLACDAGLIPAVFGGASVPLDLGRRSRTFTRAQVLALWERDGGCAFCGQTTFVEAHHIAWWDRDRGTTDLSNAVLLCSRCHHLIHRDGWTITVDETGQVRFIPPRHVDPDRVPRPAAPNPRPFFRRGHEKGTDRPLGPAGTPRPDRPPGPDRPPVRSGETRPPGVNRGWRIRRFAWRDHPPVETLRALLE